MEGEEGRGRESGRRGIVEGRSWGGGGGREKCGGGGSFPLGRIST